MDLKSLAAAAGKVELADGTKIPVRGLSLTDITALVRDHRTALSGAFEQLRAMDEDVVQSDSAIVEQLLESAPRLAGQVILLALSSKDTVEDALDLPAGLQLAVLNECGRQTFVTEGGVGKTLEIVINMLNGVTGTLAEMSGRAA